MTCKRFGWLLLTVVFSSFAAACDETAYPYELEVAGVGTIYVSSLRYEEAGDRAELSGGLCLVAAGEDAWTVSASRMEVENVVTAPRLTAQAVTLGLGEVTIFAERLESVGEDFMLQGVTVSSPVVSGNAESATYTLSRGRAALQGVRLRIGNFRVQSATATLTEGALDLREAHATTCDCEGDGLYALRAPTARIDFASGVVQVQGGALETLGLSVALTPNVQLLLDGPPQPGQPGLNLGGARVLPTPAVPEPVGETIDEGTKVSLPFQLLPGVSLELGVAGLDEGRTPGLVSLLQFGEGNVRAALGRVGPGLRADFLLRRPLAPGVGLDFSLTNRAWQEADFLHEGALRLHGSRRFAEVLGELADTLVLGGQLFTAFSSQRLPSGPVLSPRLGVRANAVYTLPPLDFGALSLRAESTLTYYPHPGPEVERSGGSAQFSVRFAPAWRATFGPLSTSVSFERLFVAGASPFSATLDRLAPRSVLDATTDLALPPLQLSLRGRYNLLFAAQGRNPVRRLRVNLSRDLPWEGVRASLRLEAELAGLLGLPEPEVNAFLRAVGSARWEASELELGAQVRYNLLAPEAGGNLELLEVSASYPVTLSDVTLRPFLALNAAPLLAASPEAPPPTMPLTMSSAVSGAVSSAVSGYGLELAVKSCCGTLTASYRLHDGAVTTAFDVRVVPAESRP